VEFVAQRLYETFPKRYRKVLIQDAAKGGEKFAAMLLNLHQIALAQLKDLGLQNGEILGKLEAVATRQQICQVMAKLGSMEIGIRSDLAQIRALLQRYIDPAAPSFQRARFADWGERVDRPWFEIQPNFEGGCSFCPADNPPAVGGSLGSR
jgi:hypothetical protein